MKTFLLLTTLLIALGIARARAEPFQGAYVGADVGNDSQLVRGKINGSNRDIGKSKSAIGAGVFAGYDFKATEKIVIGGELGVNLATIKSNATIDGTSYRTRTNGEIDLSARAGYVFGSDFLVYARAGVSFVSVDQSSQAAGGPVVKGAKGMKAGLLVGLGTEYAITDNWSAVSELVLVGTNLGGKPDKSTLGMGRATIGVAYRF